ncbi:MAG TPA: trypsin-like peptidase domain-containing protein [Terriglobia bacterium]|nr:trypsin-like peptidase domain-containing protein [Terriglobia bacterium]
MPVYGFGEIAEQLRRSTVQVASGRRGQGSGFIVKSDGVLVTNAHVTGNAEELSVRLWDGSSFPARIAARSTRRDLALLEIPGRNLKPVTLANSDELRVGELVMAVGNPFGFTGAVTTGIVHGIGRLPSLGPTKWIQADVQLAPGNSGGPLADARGNVVGVNTMIAGGLGLAVPANAVARLVAGDLEQAPLGVVLRPVVATVSGAERLGLLILEVVANGAAEYSSLSAGDILTGLEGQPIKSLDDLEEALEGSGERLLHLQFIRGDPGKVRNVTVRLGAPQAVMA